MFRRYRELEKGEFFVVGVDTAAGGLDFCAAQFISKDKLDVPLVFHDRCTSSIMTPLLHQKLEEIYDVTGVQPVVAFERQNGGVFEMERLARLNRNQKYIVYQTKTAGSEVKETTKLGWDTNSATRPKMLEDLQDCINGKLIKLYDKPTINELFSFIINKTNSGWKAQAEVGAHDDLVMALAIAWQLYQTENKPKNMLNIGQIMAQLPQERISDDSGLY